MKYLKKFDRYYNGNIMYYRYLDLQLLDNGDLKITLNDDGNEKVDEDGIDEVKFYDFFEDIESNSEYKYFDNIGESGLGMSDAPCILDGYYYDDNAELIEYERSEIYVYYDYVYKDFTNELVKNGFVIFQTIKPKTKEEIENYRREKDIRKYNI